MTDGLGFLVLSKLVPLIVYPVGSTIVLLGATMIFASCRLRRCSIASLVGGLAWLWICSTPLIAERFAANLERQYPAVALADTPVADVAIVLGGGIGLPIAPRVDIELSGAAGRVLQAARLYRAGKVKRILVTGGNMPWAPASATEADITRGLLVEWGVPNSAIQTAGRSRNTHENALEIAEMRRENGFASALLITSATHMPRAMACFRRAAIPVTASTVNVTVVDGRNEQLLDTIFKYLPDVAALATTTNAMKEWIGLWVYRWSGYA